MRHYSLDKSSILRGSLFANQRLFHSFVFGSFINTTGWNDGAAWLLGLLQGAFTLVAYDAYVLDPLALMYTPFRAVF